MKIKGTGYSNLNDSTDLYNYYRAKKGAIQLSGTSRFSFGASAFSFSLTWSVRDQTSHLPTKSLKKTELQGKQ